MDPPKRFHFNLDFEDFSHKLKLTLAILGLNSLTILGLIALAFLTLDPIQLNAIVVKLKWNGFYFSPFSEWTVLLLIRDLWLKAAIIEEFLFRYPILVLIKSNFKIRIRYDLTRPILILIALILNLVWADGLRVNNFVIERSHTIPWVVFVSGLPLYWLIIKTRSLWPSVVCHGVSNTLLYLLAQSLIYFKII